MTADELRSHSTKMFDEIKQGLMVKQDVTGCQISLQLHTFQMLAEIAAQLAELNQSYRSRTSLQALSQVIHGNTE